MHTNERFDTALVSSNLWLESTLSKADIFCVFTRIKMHKGYAKDQRRGQASNINFWKLTCREGRTPLEFKTTYPWRRKQMDNRDSLSWVAVAALVSTRRDDRVGSA